MAENQEPGSKQFARQSGMPSNITELKEASPFKQSYLDKRTHDDPEQHFIGSALPVPSVITTGGAPSVGVSPIPAREDHNHGTLGGPVGSMSMWAGQSTTIPLPYIYCDGRALGRTGYPELFAVIGTIWGAGDGSTTFNIPDMRSTFPRGGGGIGATGGSADTVLVDHAHGMAHVHGSGGLVTNNPGSHQHQIGRRQASTGNITNEVVRAGDGAGAATNADSGAAGGHTHDITGNTGTASPGSTGNLGESGTGKNLPPYANVHFMIKAKP